MTHGDKKEPENSTHLPDPSAYQWEPKVGRHSAVPGTKQVVQALKSMIIRIRNSHGKRDWEDLYFHRVEDVTGERKKKSMCNKANDLEKGD